MAFGLVQYLSVLGSAAAEQGVDPPKPLREVLRLYDIPAPPAQPPATEQQAVEHAGGALGLGRQAKRPRRKGGTTAHQRHPSLPSLFNPAAASARALLAARRQLERELGPVASGRLPLLSNAFSRWRLDLAVACAAPRPPTQWLAQLLDLAPLY